MINTFLVAILSHRWEQFLVTVTAMMMTAQVTGMIPMETRGGNNDNFELESQGRNNPYFPYHTEENKPSN